MLKHRTPQHLVGVLVRLGGCTIELNSHGSTQLRPLVGTTTRSIPVTGFTVINIPPNPQQSPSSGRGFRKTMKKKKARPCVNGVAVRRGTRRRFGRVDRFGGIRRDACRDRLVRCRPALHLLSGNCIAYFRPPTPQGVRSTRFDRRRRYVETVVARSQGTTGDRGPTAPIECHPPENNS